jgi:hypothetical protein
MGLGFGTNKKTSKHKGTTGEMIMRKLNFKTGATALAAAGLWVCASTSAIGGTTVDLTTAGSEGSIGAALFQQIDPQATGTGFIDPFLRIQANGSEAGYNTSAAGAVFDDKTGIWTHDLLLSTLTVVANPNTGVPSYKFSLDINQTKPGNLLTLNQLQIFAGNTANITGGSVSATTGYLTPPAGLTSVYDMNPTGGTDGNNVLMDYLLNSGSGSGDVCLFIPSAGFAGFTYLTLYSQFGNPPGTQDSDDGFEEWAAVVPEPTTMIAGALLLLPFGASTLRVLRNRKA